MIPAGVRFDTHSNGRDRIPVYFAASPAPPPAIHELPNIRLSEVPEEKPKAPPKPCVSSETVPDGCSESAEAKGRSFFAERSYLRLADSEAKAKWMTYLYPFGSGAAYGDAPWDVPFGDDGAGELPNWYVDTLPDVPTFLPPDHGLDLSEELEEALAVLA